MSDPEFFAPSRSYSVGEIATLCDAKLLDPGLADLPISGIASMHEGGPGTLVFVEGRRNAALIDGITASAVLCQEEYADRVPPRVATLVTKKPSYAFALVARTLYPSAARPTPVLGLAGVSPAAHVAPDAVIEDGATVEAGAVVGPAATIGRGAIIGAGAVIGQGCQVGRDSFVGPGASISASLIGDRVIIHAGARLGQDGFRFIPSGGRLVKVPQIGRVVVQDDVEIGANTTIDRGALGDTVIGEGTKIDNLVQIGHNVRIGRYCAIAAQVGVSGSVTIGDFVMLGGRVGIADHLTIGDGVQIAASSGLMHDIPAGQKWAGTPARPMAEYFRGITTLRKLADRKTRKEPNDE